MLQRISTLEARTEELDITAEGLQGQLEEKIAQLQTEVCPVH